MASKILYLNIRRTFKAILVVWFALSPVVLVICYGEDGHVAVESVFNDCCCTDETDYQPSLPEQQHSDSESEPHETCQDVPITIVTTVNSSHKTQDTLKAPTFALSADFGADLPRYQRVSGFSVTRAACSPPHTPLRSIILLL